MSIWNWLLSKIVKEPETKSPEEDSKTEDVSDSKSEDMVVTPEVTEPKVEEPAVVVTKAEPETPKAVEETVALTEAELLAGYKKAMQLKKDGKLFAAEKLLLKSCIPASVHKAHYKELFKIWRQHNREDLKAKKYRKVLDRVLKMIKLDDEMIAEMLRYWGTEQDKKLPEDYFDADRNLLVSDAKALKSAAEGLQENKNIELANSLIEKFSKK